MKRKQKQFTQDQIQLLLKSPYIRHVYSNRIKYADEFKKIAIDKYIQGFAPVQIFAEAGLNLQLIGQKNAFNLIKKWLNKPPKSALNLTLEEQVKELQAKNAYLEAELEFIKKLRALGG
jgi:transposase